MTALTGEHMKTGEFLKAARINAGLRNKDVVKATGLSSGRVSQIESYNANPNGDLPALCKLYGVKESDVPPFKYANKKAKAPTKATSDCDVYAKIAALAASIKDVDLAMEALSRMELA